MNASCVPDGVSGYVVVERDAARSPRERPSARRAVPTFLSRAASERADRERQKAADLVVVCRATRERRERAARLEEELRSGRRERAAEARRKRRAAAAAGVNLSGSAMQGEFNRWHELPWALIDSVIAAVSAVTGQHADDITDPDNRLRRNTRARGLAVGVLNSEADFSMPALAEAVGLRSHSGAIDALDKFSDLTEGHRAEELAVPSAGGAWITMSEAAGLVRERLDVR